MKLSKCSFYENLFGYFFKVKFPRGIILVKFSIVSKNSENINCRFSTKKSSKLCLKKSEASTQTVFFQEFLKRGMLRVIAMRQDTTAVSEGIYHACKLKRISVNEFRKGVHVYSKDTISPSKYHAYIRIQYCHIGTQQLLSCSMYEILLSIQNLPKVLLPNWEQSIFNLW